ncbi:MAG: ABC transporter substrate-binding protein [Cyanobium sp. CACIAM 14]|nr:MAG: ABC transporter substrate-binding protein [Cyanobium sp. CACIAM 14]
MASLAQGRSGAPVRIEGSSTVFPLMEVAVRAYEASYPDRKGSIVLKETGSTAGFRRFCSGRIPMANASRPINSRELKACAARGITFIELPVAFDAVTVVVNPANTWLRSISLPELSRLWSRKAQGRITRWNQVNGSWPDKPIRLCGPGKDSGTFDYFNKAINGSADSSRRDYSGSEDDNDTVRCVVNNPYALGYFGFSYYENNASRLRALPIEGPRGTVLPSLVNVQRELYQPLSRPLFIYVNNRALLEQPEVRSFLTFTIQRGLGFAEKAGIIPLPADTYRVVEGKLYRHLIGTSFGGDLPIGLTISQAIRRSFEQIRAPGQR